MAVSMTYTSLFQDLQRYLERGTVSDTEVFNQLPTLINLAERDIANKLKILGLINVVTNNFAAGTSTYAKPDRWRETTSINYTDGSGNRITLQPRSYEFCRYYWPNPTSQDAPEFYADYDYLNWLIAPTPDAAYGFEVLYWQLPPLLDAVNTTNWLTDYAPNALLYGSLMQCAPFLKNDERIPVWEQLYTDQLSTLDGQDLQRIIDRSVARTKN